jgi:hypothetical protein
VVVCNPAMLFMAASIMSINMKLNEIQEIQEDIFKFLERKEKATLRGNLNFLTEVLNNYKHNWNNEKYKNSNYIKVLDIKQEAERSILFYKDQISDKINKDVSNILDKQLENLSTKIQSDFREYQLSLYIYAFSSFLDVMLLENFKSDYIEGVVSKIKDKTFEYLKLYTQCYEKIDEKFNTSIQSAITNQLAKAKKYINENTKINTIINKIPISKSLSYSIDLFDKLDSTKEQAMSSFREIKDVIVRPFIDKLTTINKLYNQPFDVIFDKDNMYFNLEP